MNVFEIFTEALQRSDKHKALISGMGKDRLAVSFKDLDRRVNRVATQLQAQGLSPGDRVLLAVPVSIETYTIMLALLKAGLVIMFIDPAHGARSVSRILREWPPAAIVASKSLLLFRYLMPELRRIPQRLVVGGRSAGAVELIVANEGNDRFQPVERSAADSAMLSFTSGSTGEPKAVVRTHGFLRQQLNILNRIADVRPDDIDYVAMPMFVLFNLANGVTSVIPACDMRHPGRANPHLVLNQLLAEKVTRTVASPALLERLADYCIRYKQTLEILRCVSTGGGPVSPLLPQKLNRVAANATVRMVYGSTEAEPIASSADFEVSVTDRQEMRRGAGLLAGKPVEGCDVHIIRSRSGVPILPCTAECFAKLQQSQNEIGEIVVSGKHVLTSYADASRNVETKIEVDGNIWHRTGDAGYFDEAGRLWLVGRCNAAIIDRHGSVYPFQVEYALRSAAGVRRAALVGHEQQRVLVLETSGREFRSDCATAAQCIAEHSIDRIVTMRKIPMDKRHDAKVDYPALLHLLDGRWARMRLNIVETISHFFRAGRSLYRQIRGHVRASF